MNPPVETVLVHRNDPRLRPVVLGLKGLQRLLLGLIGLPTACCSQAGVAGGITADRIG